MSRTCLLTVLPTGVWLFASACGPGAATPMPQPPTVFDLARLAPGVAPVLGVDSAEIVGSPGTVPARATVRVTNLDQPVAAAAVDAGDNGAFSISVPVVSGQELRFEWVDVGRRSAPVDAFFIEANPAEPAFELQPSPRFECLELSPPFALEFQAAGSAKLKLSNRCRDTLTLDNPRARVGLPVFTLPTELPPIASGDSSELSVSFDSGDPANPTPFSEDTLLFDVTLGNETIRYPITLRAAPGR